MGSRAEPAPDMFMLSLPIPEEARETITVCFFIKLFLIGCELCCLDADSIVE